MTAPTGQSRWRSQMLPVRVNALRSLVRDVRRARVLRPNQRQRSTRRQTTTPVSPQIIQGESRHDVFKVPTLVGSFFPITKTRLKSVLQTMKGPFGPFSFSRLSLKLYGFFFCKEVSRAANALLS